MSAADIGASFSNYQGDANLGGGTFGVINIDTKSIEKLAAYTMLYNEAEYKQKQKDAETWATEVGKATAYDLSKVVPEEREKVLDKWNKHLAWVKNNPTAQSYSKNPELYLEYQKRQSEFDSFMTAAGGRNVMYAARQKQIAGETNVAEKARLKEELDEEVRSTDIFTPLKHSEQYELSFKDPGDPIGLVFENIYIGGNQNIKTKHSILNMQQLEAKADLYQFEATAQELDESSPEFVNASPDQQKLMRSEARARKNVRSGYQKAAENLNAVIEKFKLPGGGVDMEALRKSDAAGGIIEAIDTYNDYVNTRKKEIKEGMYKNADGKAISFDNKMLFEKNYDEINVQDGLSAKEFAKIQMFAKWKGDGRDIDVQETDNSIQQAQIAQGWARIAEEKYQFRNPQSTGGTSSSPDIIQDPAIALREHLLRVANAVNSNDKTLLVDKTGLDALTKSVMGIDDRSLAQKVRYNADGSYELLDAGNKKVGGGTLEGLKKNYIESFKTAGKPDGVNDDTWQKNVEKGFITVFGTNDVSQFMPLIRGGGQQQATAPTAEPPKPTKNTISRSEVITKANEAGMSVKEYTDHLKKNNVRIINN